MRNVRIILLPLLFLPLIACQNNNENDEAELGAQNTRPIEVEQSVEYNEEERKSSAQISKRLVDLSTGVKGVKEATAVVLGRYAVVGIDVEDDLDRSRVSSIKYSVAEALQHDPYGANALVTADPDIYERVAEMGRQIRDGQPVGGILEELAAITGRLMPEFPAQINKKEPDPTRKNDKDMPERDENQLRNQQQKQGKSSPSEPNRIKEQD
ncbi:YhcN/YlaJ family sporulation lipoprotein [Alkalihalobacillus sp. AL-G]|uniref:YhcN/YlaJ family sporulation lipoprotein n=1 Tax=Alkalihalobacillus sp. AL-G TaxID=2926399 RepID=UPI00272C7F45|nr:YhcN/YlaJ family sporulation lipoprotein [Alkalihalobacillus sp. AL-G]WLD95019.1 YhcN/YlaJ family sporulation lipoprotein [Alkalihalobacillus sp. AL-G]